MILFISRKYPPSIGGMQRLSYELTTRIGKLADTFVISWGHSQIFLPLFLVYAFLKAIVIVLTKKEVELIHLGDPVLSPLGLLLKFLFGLPIVVNIHGLDIVFPNRFYQRFIPRCLRRMDKLICISPQTKEECVKRGIAGKRCTVIPVGIDADRFRPVVSADGKEAVEALIGKRLDGVKILLTAGRLVKRKGVLWFISRALPRIIAEQPNVCYLIVGEGPQHGSVEKRVRHLDLEDKVVLLGKVDDKTLRIVYNAADIFVMPNIPVKGDFEGFGIAAIEAAAAGLCVVASRLDGIPSAIIEGENGFLVSPEDVDAYVRIIVSLLKDANLRRNFGERAREFTRKNYSWQKIAGQYLRVFKQVIAEHKQVRDSHC